MNTEMINTNDELTLDQLDDVSGGKTWIQEKGEEIADYVVEALGFDELVEALGGFKPLPDGSGDYNPGRPSGKKF